MIGAGGLEAGQTWQAQGKRSVRKDPGPHFRRAADRVPSNPLVDLASLETLILSRSWTVLLAKAAKRRCC